MFRCRGEFDHMTAYVEFNNRMSEIGTFCGTDTPPQLMSSRNQLTLEFIAQTALNPYPRVYRGFQLTYKFVTDFGIHSGTRDLNHGTVIKKICFYKVSILLYINFFTLISLRVHF